MKLNSTLFKKRVLNLIKSTCLIIAFFCITSIYSSNSSTLSSYEDTEPPTSPAGLSWVYDEGNNATWISWNASTDNVGVSYYEVFENGEHFYALDQTKLGFGGKPKKTYVFTVLAVDAAGNKSPLSEPLIVSPEEPTNPCDGIEEWRPGLFYQTGDRVTYRGNLYEFQTSRWVFISSCEGSRSKNDAAHATNQDTEAPTTPTGLSYRYDAGNDVTWISWNTSTDNIGVSFYEVFENGNPFYALDQTKLGFGGKPKRTSTFTVLAVDKAGNKSPLSEPLVVSPDLITNPCNGIREWNSTVNYQVGDRVTYRGNLYERQAFRWAFISSCNGAKSLNNSNPTIGNTFTAYPNPVSKELKIITNPMITPSKYSIIDMNGRTISTQDYSSSVDVESLQKGVYIINLISEDNNKIGESIFVKK